jgi:LmbE family N-acetylglucosaminyl deacetylase
MGDVRKVAMAIAAHPDDIEFMMAGTLILLGRAGYQLHYLNIANGSCGTVTLSRDEIVALRAEEANAAAQLIGAQHHPSLVNDIDIFYDKGLLAKVGAIVREVDPGILLVPSPEEYMEDHANSSRLAVSAAFCRGMRNFPTDPPRPPVVGEVALYHALPYGLHDGLRRRVFPGEYVDVTSVIDLKQEMLARHRSQKEWLDRSQGLNAYLTTMVDMAAEVGRMSGRFRYAEGWRRHSHLGFSGSGFDPLREALGEKVFIDRAYEQQLERPPAARTEGVGDG